MDTGSVEILIKKVVMVEGKMIERVIVVEAMNEIMIEMVVIIVEVKKDIMIVRVVIVEVRNDNMIITEVLKMLEE